MRIIRYPLEIVEYQQLQPLWPGNILSVGIGRDPSRSKGTNFPTIDMWCLDDHENREDHWAPVLGIWILGTGRVMPDEFHKQHPIFHGTVDMRQVGRSPLDLGAWHVWSAGIGHEQQVETGWGEVGKIDDMVEKLKARHGKGTQ